MCVDLERRTKRSGDAKSSTASKTATSAGVRICPSFLLAFLFCVWHMWRLCLFISGGGEHVASKCSSLSQNPWPKVKNGGVFKGILKWQSGWDLAECMVRASDSQLRSLNWSGLDPSILRHSGIWGAADEVVLSIVHKKNPLSTKKGGVCFDVAYAT